MPLPGPELQLSSFPLSGRNIAKLANDRPVSRVYTCRATFFTVRFLARFCTVFVPSSLSPRETSYTVLYCKIFVRPSIFLVRFYFDGGEQLAGK